MNDLDFGRGEKSNDWTSDIALRQTTCTEEKCIIKVGQPFWVKGKRRLCYDCITMVLNAREDYIEDLIKKLCNK